MANVQRSISDPDFTRVSTHAETIEFDGVHETPFSLIFDNVVLHPLLPSRPPSEFQSRPPSVKEQLHQQIFTYRRADRLRELMLELNQFGYDAVPLQNASSSLPALRGPDQSTRNSVDDQSSNAVPKQTRPSIPFGEVAVGPVPCPSGRRVDQSFVSSSQLSPQRAPLPHQTVQLEVD